MKYQPRLERQAADFVLRADVEPMQPSDYDLDRCAQQQVHTIGYIQPHGVLFALSEPDLFVRQVSANVSDVCGVSAETILNQSFVVVLGERQFELFRTQVLNGEPLFANPLRTTVNGSEIDTQCIAHRQDGVLIVEFELLQSIHHFEPLNLNAHIRLPLSRMESGSGILELSQLAASEIRRLSGFDRAMIYRFDEEWSGEVIAESVSPSSASYLGLRFPASDIPAQVRQLFLLNRLRAIVDIDAVPVPIVPEIGPITGRVLDLTCSFLRSPAPIHLEYLRNMGVKSSLVVSIVVGNQLWGMIACHHYSRRHVDCSTRSVCELIGQMFGSQVALRVDNTALQVRLASRKLLQSYMEDSDASQTTVYADHFRSDRLLELFEADGLVLHLDGVLSSHGLTVEDAALLLPIVSKLQALSTGGIGSSNMLSQLDPNARAYAHLASGALYIGLSAASGDYLLLVRRELLETVVWAGNPDKSVNIDERGELHPRASFAAWQQTARYRSQPWRDLELESARFLREQLLRRREALNVHNVEKVRLFELEQSVRRFRFVADNMPQLVWTTTPDGRADYFNQRWHSYTGISVERSQEAGWQDVLHPDDLSNCLARWTSSVATGCDYEAEYRIRRDSDGIYEWHLARGFPLRSHKGGVIQWVGTCTNIERQRRARQDLEEAVAVRTAELRQVQERLQTVVDGATTVSIIAADTEGVITVFNSGAENLLGYAAEELVGRYTPEVFHLESEVIARGLELSEATGTEVKGNDVFIERARHGLHEEREWTYVRKDGSHLTVNLVVTCLRDAFGTSVGFLGVAMDLTERKRAEDVERATNEHFRLIVETVEDYALIMLDPEGNVISWNLGGERIKGYKADEIIGKHFSIFYSPEDIARRHPDAELRIAAEHGRYTEEGWRVRKDGSRFLADVFIASIHDDNGRLRGFAKVVHDITERKKSEERFQLVVEAAPSAMIMTGTDGLIALVNTQTEKLFQFDRHELLGRPIEMLLPERFRPNHGGLLRGFFAAPATRAMGAGKELFGVSKDGTEVPIEIGLNPISTSQGQFVLASIIDITERKQTQQRLREQALILEVANDSILIRDSQDRITYWNQGAEKLYGWSKEESVGHISHALLKTEFPQPLGDITAQLLAEGSWKGELKHSRCDGSWIIVASHWTLQRDQANQATSVLEINYDLTSRKRTEEQLQKTQARMSAIFNGSLDGVIVFEAIRDQDGALRDLQFVMVNQAAGKLMGVDAVSIIGKGLLESFPNTARDGLFDNLSRTIHSDISFDEEYLSFRKAVPHWFRTAGVKLGDGVVLSYTEITERKRSEDQLRTAVRRLGLATDALNAGIWDWDIRTDGISWDQRMYEIYRIPPGTPIDYQLWEKVVLPEDFSSAEAALHRLIASKSQTSYEFRINLPDGSIRYIQAAAGAILDDAGNVIRVIGINIDTTDRKFNEDLERQVGERTAQLKAANIELEEFAFVASHDLKAPLRVIDNASKWLEEDLQEHLTEETRESLSLVRGRVRRMDKLLDDLLEYARIGRATDGRFVETVDGNVLISDVLGLIDPRDFTVRVGPGFSAIQVCRMPLQQILINLIGNAIKHHDKKTGCIDVTVEDHGECYEFAVKDDGPGIPAQFHDQIFKMFQTLRPRDQVEGSGMGLAMVRKSVEVFGGVLELDSAAGRGSLFRFTWPKQQQLRTEVDYELLRNA